MIALLFVLPMAAVDLGEILPRALAAEQALEGRRGRYTFRELQENFDKPGAAAPERTKRYENLFVEGRLFRKLVERNGRPLSAKEKKKVEEELARTAQVRREERRRRAPFLPGVRVFGIGTLEELKDLASFRLVDDGAHVEGRRALLVEAEPLPDLAERRPARRELACYRQRFWIDAEEFVVLRREVDVVRPGAELLPGTTLISEFAVPAPGQPRFEVRRVIDFKAKVVAVRTVQGKQVHTYSDFREFNVESTITFDPQ